jgi:hypothetical protein
MDAGQVLGHEVASPALYIFFFFTQSIGISPYLVITEFWVSLGAIWVYIIIGIQQKVEVTVKV